VNTPYVDLSAYVGFVSIVSGRNAKDGKGTEAHRFKNGDWDKTIEIAR
jgi:hypothetical protein